MDTQVLVSTMNQMEANVLAHELRINKYVVINQIISDISLPKDILEKYSQFRSFREKGLSKSRNKAISNASGDICLIADDDMYYVDNYEQIVSDAYSKYTSADIIAFYVDNEDTTQLKKQMREGKLNLLQTMKISSCQISFKRKSIIDKNIRFDESFGTGTENYMGEENIFLFDCYYRNLKIYYVPIKIATLRLETESTWFRGYDAKYFIVKGKVFYRMSHILWPLLIIQFVFRKKRLYHKQLRMHYVMQNMFMGAYYQMRCTR